MRITNDRKRNRKASVAVEVAITAPILFVMIFAGIEFARVHMIQCAVENAAFEGARAGIIPGATSSNCQSIAEDLLSIAGVKEATVTVTPSNITANDDIVTIKIDVPLVAANGFGISGFLKNRTLTKEVEMPREGSALGTSNSDSGGSSDNDD